MVNLIPFSAEHIYHFFEPVKGSVVISKKFDGRESSFNSIKYRLNIENLQHSSQEIVGYFNNFLELDEILYAGLGFSYQEQVSNVLYNILKNIFGENSNLCIKPNNILEYYSGYINDNGTLIIFFTTFQDFPIFSSEFPEKSGEDMRENLTGIK